MIHSKKTGRALLLSVLSLFLCLSLLIGATYAWFTDSVSSSRNLISAGNLDVSLEYHDGAEWVGMDEHTALFEETLWEPGHTRVVYLRIRNLGSLAFRYELSVYAAGLTLGTNVYGDSFSLADHLSFGVAEVQGAEAFESRAEALAAVSLQPMTESYGVQGFMTASAPDRYLALVVTMPETVGNVANHKNDTTPPTVDLGIRLNAYQTAHESDSFGKDYDEKVVYTVSQLQSALEKGGYVTLGADLTVDGGQIAWDYNGSASKAAHLYVPEGVKCTLDLGGHVLKNTHVSGTVRHDVIANYGTLTLTDSIGSGELISDNNAANPNVSGGFALISYGDLHLKKVDIDSNTGSYAVYIEGAGKTMTVDGATVSGRGALAVYNGAHGVIRSGDFSIDVLTTNARDNVLALYNATAEVHGGRFDGTLKTLGSNDSFNWKGSSCVMLMGASSTAYIYGGTFEAREADLFSHGAGCKIYAYGGSFNTVNVLGNSALHEHNSRALVEVYGGTYIYDPTDYLAAGYAAEEQNGFYTVKKFTD